MTERTLNNLIRASLLVAVISFVSIQTAWLDGVVQMRYMKILFMAALVAVPMLLMLKVISRIFLEGFKGQRLSFIENMFMLYYIFLTKEAREEWRSYIEEQKKKESKT
ncbi:MAG: hypothetical protein H6R10_2607 [Rhodocyclaceae bacterium]|nr:hypothetical protein [Rhodocyclaceae bacterium]